MTSFGKFFCRFSNKLLRIAVRFSALLLVCLLTAFVSPALGQEASGLGADWSSLTPPPETSDTNNSFQSNFEGTNALPPELAADLTNSNGTTNDYNAELVMA